MPFREWERTTLGEICDAGGAMLQTGPFGSQLHSYDYQPVGIAVVPTEAIGQRRLKTDDLPRVSAETAQRLERHKLQAGDILFARRGVQATGLSAIVGPDQEGWLCGTGAILLRIRSKTVDPTFVSFALSAPVTIQWLKSHAVGAVMPNLNEGVLRNLPLHVPPLDEQRAIAQILGSLDDKIELNRRMNETLKAMARTLFRSWFVDFDPVRAKTDGTKPQGIDADTAALFPDGFEDSPLGKVPKRWRVESIGKLVDVVGGSTPSTDEPSYWNGEYNFATPKDMASLTSPVLLTTERTITAAGLERISSGLLPAGVVLMSSRAPIGYLAISEIPVAVNQGFIAMRCTDAMPNYYILQWAGVNMDEIVAHANGTTFLEISKTNFRPLRVLVPAEPVLRAYSAAVKPLYRRIVSNLDESRTLAGMRDALLPRLLSGEVQV